MKITSAQAETLGRLVSGFMLEDESIGQIRIIEMADGSGLPGLFVHTATLQEEHEMRVVVLPDGSTRATVLE